MTHPSTKQKEFESMPEAEQKTLSISDLSKIIETAYDKEIDSYGGSEYASPSGVTAVAQAIAKLGTIRIVE
jgi:hypothetical protein